MHHIQCPPGGRQFPKSDHPGRNFNHQQEDGLLVNRRDDVGDHPERRDGPPDLHGLSGVLLPQQEREEGQVEAVFSSVQPGQISESHQNLGVQNQHGIKAKGGGSFLRGI